MDVRIRGADQLGDLSKRLRAAGEEGKGLRRELYRGLNRATKPLKADAKAATDRLPQAGGLAGIVAKSKFSTRTRAGRSPSVSIQAKGTAARSTDRGIVRHPVHGNRDVWVTQSVRPGWFSEAMQAGAPRVRQELLEVMEHVARQIARG